MHSITRIGGALERRDDGAWHWSASGALAPEVTDLPLREVLPQFPMRYQHDLWRVQVRDGWQEDFPPIEADVVRIVAWACRVLGERALMVGQFKDPPTAVRRARPQGFAIKLPRWEVLGARVIPQWPDAVAPAVLQAAADAQGSPRDSDLDADLRRTLDHFYCGSLWPDPTQAAARWYVVEQEIRQRFPLPADFASAERRAWRWHPDPEALLSMTDEELRAFARAFAFP